MQKSLSNVQDHIWFERSEMKDRLIVAKRLIFFLYIKVEKVELESSLLTEPVRERLKSTKISQN